MATEETEVHFENATYRMITEGLAKILGPTPSQSQNPNPTGDQHAGSDKQAQSVFYNPIQQFNRDLSVLAIRVFAEDLEAVRSQKGGSRRIDKRLKRTQPNQSLNASKAAGKAPEGVKTCSEGKSIQLKQDRLLVREAGKASGANANDNAVPGQQNPDEVNQQQYLHEVTHSEKRKRDADDAISIEEGPPRKVPKPDSPADGEPDVTGSGRWDNPATGESSSNGRDLANTTKADGAANSTSSTDRLLHPEGKLAGHGLNGEAPGSNQIPTGPKCTEASAASSHLFQFRILDALSATGLRALRYASEVSQVTSVTANDCSPSAAEAIHLNVRYNQLEPKIIVTRADANAQMRSERLKYEVIDLDPYGTATPFIDDAVRSLTNGGLLCATCTDSGVFASVGYSEKTFSQYGGMTIKGPYSHEAGLRLLLQAIAASAARYGLAIEPLLSLSIDFYIRVFVRVHRSPQDVKLLASKSMLVYNCDSGCGAWTVQYMGRTKIKEDKKGNPTLKFSLPQAPTASPNCEHCGFKTHLAGPMWGGPIHNPMFIQRMLDILPHVSKDVYETLPRMEGMLMLARDETLMVKESQIVPASASNNAQDGTSPYPLPKVPAHEIDHHPFYFFPSALASVLHTIAPSTNALRGALIGLGYRVRRSHTKPGSMRTDAPWSVIWEVMREWVRQKAPFKEGSIKPGTAGWGIMRNDRILPSVDSVKADLEDITKTTETLDEMRTKLQALLWRLDHHTQSGSEPTPTDKGGSSHQANAHDQPTDGDKMDVTETKETSLSQLKQLKIEFNEALGQASEAKKKLVRYQQNPRANWGPMTRAKG